MPGIDLLQYLITIISLSVFCIIAVTDDLVAQQNRGWSTEVEGVGIYSSPRAADLNDDGVKDIILGSGKLEFQETDTAVIALDGTNGSLLWNVGARDQIFGTANLMDITGDGIPDVFIGGRSAEFMAINGKSGEIIWEYFPEGDSVKPRTKGLFNFYNSQFIPDQNQDGLKDIIVSNGGDVSAKPFDPDRPPGKLMVISSSNGQLIAQAEMPDGKETYMSIVVSKMHKSDTRYTILFGTGGETLGGNFYRTTLQDVMNEDLSESVLLASSGKKGFIAPPVLADINLDGHYDIITNAVEGRVYAFDGKTNELIWDRDIKRAEAYGTLAVGHFNDDDIPDFVTTYSEGMWPYFDKSEQIMIDGKNGNVAFRDSLGAGQISSPVVYDFTSDGYDDALISVNFTSDKANSKIFNNMLVIYDFKNGEAFQAAGYNPGFNLASTPWIGDLDGNGRLDIVYCSLTETKNRFAMNGFRIIRLNTSISLKSEIKWGGYMGNNLSGKFY